MTYCIHYNAFKVFGKVAARLDPQPLGLSFSSLEEILQSIKDKAVVERRRIFDGFVVSGTFEEIAKVRSLLQKIIPISSHQGKREPVQTDCRKSVYPKAIRESPRADKSFFEPANGQKHPNRNLTGKANLRESQGRGLNQRINMVNSKETNKEEDKLVHPETLTYGSAVPLFDLPGAESSCSVEQKRESVKTELRSRGRNQYQAKATRTEDSMTTAERKRKTDEARKLEDELKKSQILGVGKRWLSREEAEKFSDLGGPQIMAQNHKRSTDLSDYKKHKVENTFLDEKNIDTRREIPIQKVTNKEIGEMSQGTTTESSAIKKSFVEDDPNERTENTELVMVTTSDDASGSTSEPAPFPYGTELRSNNQNQDETKPFETLSRKQQGGNNNGLRGVKEKGNSPLDSGGEAVRSDHIEENDMDETQRNEICEKQVQPQSKNPKSPNESIKELESTISRRESNHIKFSTETGITVVLLEGDITNHHADLLIRPINPSLCHKERLSNQFQDRGGTLLKDECQRSTQGQETPNYGEVYFTDSGNLPCKAILHAILPLWTEEKKDTKDLKHLIHVCLKKGLILASEHGHRSVALPPLGQEGNPIPVRVSAQVTTRVIASFSRSVSPLHNGVTDLHIVCNDDATFNVFAKQLREFSFRDKQRPYFVQAEDKTVPYQSIGRYGTELKTVEHFSLKGTPRQENQNTTMLPVSKTDLASQPASLSHGTKSRRNNLIRNETKPCKALPKNRQDDDDNSRLKNVKEEENAFLENGGEAVTNHPKDETMFTEALKQSEICGEEAHQQPKSPNSDESIEDAESSTIVMGNNHVKFSAETGITVMLLKGNVTSHNADVLISPANPSLCYKEGLSRQIQETGGRSFKDECLMITQGQKMLKYGEVLVTGSGNLPYKAVLHAILPLWTDDKEEKKELKCQIHACLKSGLILASGHRHRSVAFPLLGQEWNPIPVQVSAEVITRVIATFSESVGPLHSGVTDFHIVCEDDAAFNVYVKELREFLFRDKQRPHFVQAEDKTVPYQSIERYGTGLKTDELSSLKGTPRQENQNTTMLPVSKTDLASQPASFSHGTESRRNNLVQNETKPCKALPKNQQDDDDNSGLKNVKEEENAFLENGGEAVTNHPKDETMFTETLKQSEICGEEAHQQSKSPNSDESIEYAESSTIVMGNNHVKFSTETGITVMLLKGNVTSHNADVLISPANPSLCYKEGISRQIQETGGRSLKDECLMITQGQKMLKYGEVLVTGSGNLPYKAVLHAILPLWTDDKEEKKELKCQIHACLKSGLILASGHRHRSVAFPLLGQEWNPIPVQVSAEVITRVIATFSKSVGPLHSGVTDFHIVCEDAASFKAFAKELEEFSFPHKQQKHFVTRKSPDEIFCQSAAFSISLKPDSVPKEDNGMTQMVSHREEIVTSLTEIKSSEELSARNEEMTTIEVDDFTRPVEVRAFEILEATSGRRLSQLVGELSQSFPDGESIKREMGEELKRDEFEEQVTENHDFEKKSSAQLQQSTAVDPFSKREEMGQRHAQRNVRHITKPPPLSMGKKTIVRRISNSSSLQDGGRMLKGFMSPTIEALMNADLHLGAQGLKLLHDDDGNVKKKEDLEKSFLLDSHDENCSTAFSVPHLDGHQSDDNMPQNCGRKVEKILDSDMELGTLDILETTNQNSPSVREKDEKNGSHTLPEKNGR